MTSGRSVTSYCRTQTISFALRNYPHNHEYFIRTTTRTLFAQPSTRYSHSDMRLHICCFVFSYFHAKSEVNWIKIRSIRFPVGQKKHSKIIETIYLSASQGLSWNNWIVCISSMWFPVRMVAHVYTSVIHECNKSRFDA